MAVGGSSRGAVYSRTSAIAVSVARAWRSVGRGALIDLTYVAGGPHRKGLFRRILSQTERGYSKSSQHRDNWLRQRSIPLFE